MPKKEKRDLATSEWLSQASECMYKDFCYLLVHFNPFTLEFLKWTLPSLNLDSSIVANWENVKVEWQILQFQMR